MEIFLFWFIFSFIVGYFATTKNRSGFGWFFFSICLSPILGIIFVAVLPKKTFSESLESQLKAAEAAKNRGLITEEEYKARRKKIIES
jgi:hypothetical protein